MSVVNVKVSYIRNQHPSYDNLREWMEDENNVYIGQHGVVFIDKVRFPPTNSIWCNPYKINATNTRDMVVQQYQDYITARLEKEPALVNALRALRGKNLGCWCAPEKCHGNILLKLINELPQ